MSTKLSLRKKFTQRLIVDENPAQATELFRKSFKMIGSITETIEVSKDHVILKGSSSFGLQHVPLQIELQSTEVNSTSVTIEASSDDLFAKGAKRVAERLLEKYEAVKNGQVNLSEQSEFKTKTGFSKGKLSLVVAIFTIVICVIVALINKFLHLN